MNETKRIVAIIQARLGSTRLPNKVISDIIGKPMITHIIERIKRAKSISTIMVATTRLKTDNQIIEIAKQNDCDYYQGEENDVLDRYYNAARYIHAEIIVRITSDCPLIDPEIIDTTVEEMIEDPTLDYVSNVLSPRTFPRGLDVEVIRNDALQRAWYNDDNVKWREHVTPYIYNHPEMFKLKGLWNNIDYSKYRWTVDTKEDLLLVNAIYAHFNNNRFSWTDVIYLMGSNPELYDINKNVLQKPV